MDLPEERARANIDRLLTAAGWEVQDRSRANLGAAVGVAVREFPLATGEADYLLFVNRKAIGAVEAKPEGATLSGVEAQSGKYSIGLPAHVPAWHRPLPFLYTPLTLTQSLPQSHPFATPIDRRRTRVTELYSQAQSDVVRASPVLLSRCCHTLDRCPVTANQAPSIVARPVWPPSAGLSTQWVTVAAA